MRLVAIYSSNFPQEIQDDMEGHVPKFWTTPLQTRMVSESKSKDFFAEKFNIQAYRKTPKVAERPISPSTVALDQNDM